MIISASSPNSTAMTRSAGPEDAQLRQVAKNFEEVLIGTLLKQGMESVKALAEKEDGEASSSAWKEMAWEQMNKHVASNMDGGLADAIYQSLKMKQGGQS
ncbi:MAG: hypothetical protein RL095_983 [Verrucomicrobiota bacterium]